MSSTRHPQTGFSLLELVITLAISAILVGMAMPSLQSFMGDSEMTATSNEFVYALQTARSEAIKRARPVGMCPSRNSMTVTPSCTGADYAGGWIVFVDTDGNGSRDADDEVLLQAEPRSTAFSFTADTVFAQRVYFGEAGSSINPAGVPLSGTIDISRAGNAEQRTIRVAANGRITTKPAGS
ncbi:MAG: prepilin-type N-terminal cleavage/methylation domain-containing protein [Granulosicoccus sp.]|nr:prepilin-type N-terminal cleavage/methylation domain-containing protein [Granulosicoccus sp.]